LEAISGQGKKVRQDVYTIHNSTCAVKKEGEGVRRTHSELGITAPRVLRF
jgi:hypothetical protein